MFGPSPSDPQHTNRTTGGRPPLAPKKKLAKPEEVSVSSVAKDAFTSLVTDAIATIEPLSEHHKATLKKANISSEGIFFDQSVDYYEKRGSLDTITNFLVSLEGNENVDWRKLRPTLSFKPDAICSLRFKLEDPSKRD